MSAANSDSPFQGDSSGFSSRDCELVIIDGPGDTTIRPARPLLRKLGLAERQRREKWLKQRKQPPEPPKSPEGSDEENKGK